MIRNRYHYLTPSVQDTKGKEGPTQSNTLQAEIQKNNFFPKTGQTAIQNKTKFTGTDIQRHTMTEIVNHSRSIA